MKLIPLTKGCVTFVDDADYESLIKWSWHLNCGYAARQKYIGIFDGQRKQEMTRMHQQILGIRKGRILIVDHIDGDKLNNQRANLRWATTAQNQMNRKPVTGNSSQFKGVYWNKTRQKWVAQIKIDGRSTHIGHFNSELAAAEAYDDAAIRHFGDFAKTNRSFYG